MVHTILERAVVIRSLLILACLLFPFAPWAYAGAPKPFADVHLHFDWDHEEVLTIKDAVNRLRQQNVVLAVISTTPPENALAFRKQAGKWVIPFFRPYLRPGSRHDWYLDSKVLNAAEKGLASGQYQGIGEFHLISGIGPRRDNRILHGLIRLARKYHVPVLVHTEASSERYFLPLCKRYTKVRFLWAHVGGILPAKQVDSLMSQCSNVWAEFSARDNWRYFQTPITGKNGHLLKSWRQLILKYPRRFMVGSDPVYPVDNLHYWADDNTGWDMFPKFLNYHRRWLQGLPKEVELRLRLSNAQRFFRNKGRRH